MEDVGNVSLMQLSDTENAIQIERRNCAKNGTRKIQNIKTITTNNIIHNIKKN